MFGNGARPFFSSACHLDLDARFGVQEQPSCVNRPLKTPPRSHLRRGFILRTRRIDPTRPRASAALVNAQHELAFRKRRVKDEGKDPERDDLAAGWRDEIRNLRGAVFRH
jgi:hypothetical protein